MQNEECGMQKRSAEARSGMRRSERDIAQRTFAFALRIVRLVNAMPKDVAAAAIARQLIRSGTSVGANLEEAEAGHSKAEFVQKVNIARREARETHYWLRLINESNMVQASRMTELIAEAEEIVKILTAIVRNARRSGK